LMKQIGEKEKEKKKEQRVDGMLSRQFRQDSRVQVSLSKEKARGTMEKVS